MSKTVAEKPKFSKGSALPTLTEGLKSTNKNAAAAGADFNEGVEAYYDEEDDDDEEDG